MNSTDNDTPTAYFVAGQHAALRGKFRVIANGKTIVLERAWLDGYDSVAPSLRNTAPKIGPIAPELLARLPTYRTHQEKLYTAAQLKDPNQRNWLAFCDHYTNREWQEVTKLLPKMYAIVSEGWTPVFCTNRGTMRYLDYVENQLRTRGLLNASESATKPN